MAASVRLARSTSARRPGTALEVPTVVARLARTFPNATTELHFRNAFELLVATILSAQSTDARVNTVTPALFARYPDAASLAAASTEELEPQIVPTGFFRQKSKALVGMARALVERHGGRVPASMEALTALPGVGRKTANVVLGHALGVPGLPVDRHVLRVANRIGIANANTPERVEEQLCAALAPEQWTLASDCLILHGRRVCRPRPLCQKCVVNDVCVFYGRGGGPHVAPPARRAKAETRPETAPAPAQRRRATKAPPAGRTAKASQGARSASAPSSGAPPKRSQKRSGRARGTSKARPKGRSR